MAKSERELPARALELVRGRRRLATVRALVDPAAAKTDGMPDQITLAGTRYRLVPIDDTRAPQGSVTLSDVLTARELQIVSLVADGRPNKQIADQLQISEWTVSTHLRRIFAKLQVDTRAAMVSRCFELVRQRRDAP